MRNWEEREEEERLFLGVGDVARTERKCGGGEEPVEADQERRGRRDGGLVL